MLAEAFVLRGNTHGARIGITLAHHHTTEDDERQGSERELVGSEHRHDYDILGGLQLAVGLQAHLIAQAIDDQRLLGLCESDLRRDACKTHGRGGRSTCAALGTGDDDEVGLGFGNACCDSSHATLCHKLHTDGCRGVDILEVEDELCQVLDAIDIMMRWRRDERDARNGITRLGDNLVDLETRQLAALTRLGALRHLDLYLFGIHQVFCRHAKTTGCNLFGL